MLLEIRNMTIREEWMRERYTDLVSFGIAAAAKREIEKMAEREGLTIASYARRAVLAGLRQDTGQGERASADV
jgi:hypothetical protein